MQAELLSLGGAPGRFLKFPGVRSELLAGGLVIDQQGHAVVAVSGWGGGKWLVQTPGLALGACLPGFLGSGPELGSSSQARRGKLSDRSVS